jgi:hypothetical protein
MATPIDDFIAGQNDFVGGVKGLPFTPGKLGFPEGISVGKKHAAQTALVHGAEASTSFWWNLGPETDMTIQNIARNSIGYANAENIRNQSVNPAAAEGMGISPKELSEISKNPQNRGSIAFSKLDAKKTSLYHGGGEEIGEAIQTTDKVTKYTLMDLPDSVVYDRTGPKIIVDGKKTALSKEILKQDPQFHDWMKTFAQNIKDTVGDGARLPSGTQELLDAPTFDEGNAAFRKYLESVGKANDFPEARLTTIMPDSEGLLSFQYTGPEGQSLNAQTRRASIDAHISRPVLGPEAKISTSAIMDIGTPAEGLATRAGMQRNC